MTGPLPLVWTLCIRHYTSIWTIKLLTLYMLERRISLLRFVTLIQFPFVSPHRNWGKEIFSVCLSLIMSILWESRCDHYPYCLWTHYTGTGTGLCTGFKLVKHGPHHTGNCSQICSNLITFQHRPLWSGWLVLDWNVFLFFLQMRTELSVCHKLKSIRLGQLSQLVHSIDNAAILAKQYIIEISMFHLFWEYGISLRQRVRM